MKQTITYSIKINFSKDITTVFFGLQGAANWNI